jgi:type II secretory pathway pseudopilin PulG
LNYETRRKRSGGFAMLLVLLMAAMVSITLYMALPRAAFEAQREKEQSLIDRGNQYKRAIQLYVRQNKRWPAKVEDLEDTNGKRYLRRRYVDPMTGKDEWRLVHVGPNGVLTDSLIKKATDKDKSTYSNNFITELGGVSATPDGTSNPGNPGLRRRPSDQTPGADGSVQPGQPGTGPGQTTVAGVNPPSPTGPPYTPQPGQGNFPPGLQVPNAGQPASTGLPQQLQGGNNPSGGAYSGPPSNTQASGGITVLGGVGGGGYSTAPGANGSVQPPMQGTLQGQNTGAPAGQFGQAGANGTTPAGAAQLIQGLLTSPRPGGAPGSPMGSAAGQVQGGGIAGIASKFEGDAIKVYNDQTEYQKWEFVYDMSKDTMITGAQQAIPQPAGPNTTNGFSSGSSSSSSSFGQSSSFGNPASPAGTATTSATGH